MELKIIRYTIALLLFSFPIASFSPLVNNGFRVELSHVDSKSNFTRTELLRRAAARTMHRLSRLERAQLFSSTNITSTMHSGVPTGLGEYLMDLAIGTPPLHYSAVVDTGSDLIWTRCTPSKKCVSQPTPIYKPSSSSTFSSVPCNSTIYLSMCTSQNPPPFCLCSYNYPYDKGWTRGALGKETFTFGNTKSVSASNITFGCSTSMDEDAFNCTSGLVGLGRGKLSLTSQLNITTFSYCLTSFLDTNSKSTLLFGPLAKFSGTAVKSTPFVKNPSMRTRYYLSLQGISLGATNLPIRPDAFALQLDGTGGLIIDSGTTITYLITEAYQAVKNAIGSIVKLHRADGSDTGLDLCYSLPSGSSPPLMPNLTLHFEGADMVLPGENYMLADQELWCLTLSESHGLSILGNYQQQNLHILYDMDKEVLSFVPAKCSNL